MACWPRCPPEPLVYKMSNIEIKAGQHYWVRNEGRLLCVRVDSPSVSVQGWWLCVEIKSNEYRLVPPASFVSVVPTGETCLEGRAL